MSPLLEGEVLLPWGGLLCPPPSPTETHYFARISSQRTLARISAHLHLIKIPIKIPLFSASSFLNTPKHHSDFCRVCCKKIPLVIFSQFVPIFGPLRQPPRLLVDKLFVLHEQLYILYLNSSAVNIPQIISFPLSWPRILFCQMSQKYVADFMILYL